MSEFTRSDAEKLDTSSIAPSIASSSAVVSSDVGELQEVLVSDDDVPDDNDDDNDNMDTASVWSDYTDDNVIKDDDYEIDDTNDDIPVDMAIATFRGHSDCVYCSAIHPSIKGLMISGGGDDKAYIWKYQYNDNLLSNNIIDNDVTKSGIVDNDTIELLGHTDTVSNVGFNFDGTLALTGAYDGTIKIWKVENGELLLTLEGPEDVEWAQWHPKGNAIIAGSKDGTAWMWLAHNGQCIQVFAGHDGGVMAGCFSLDGKFVCTGGEDGTVRIWAPKTGQCKHTFEGYSGHEGMITCLVSSQDGDMLISGSVDGTIKLLQISGKRVLQSFIHSHPTDVAEGDAATNLETIAEEDNDNDEMNVEEKATMSVECVGFSSNDYKWVASGGMDSNLKIWDVVAGTCRVTCPHKGGVVALIWHAKYPTVTTSSLDNNVRIWDARSGSMLVKLSGHMNNVTSLHGKYCDGATDNNDTSDSSDSNDIDVISSVSDDYTTKVFHVHIKALIS